MRQTFVAGADDDDRRIETVLRRLCPGQSLGSLHKALRKGDIRLNGGKVTPETRVNAGDRLEIWEVLVSQAPPARHAVTPLPDAWVLCETVDLIVVNKPSGILTHRGESPRPGDEPLDERVRQRLEGSVASLAFRPGPLHRLDRETSGIVVFSKSLVGARTFSRALADRRMTKVYLTVLQGELTEPRQVRNFLSRDGQSRVSREDTAGEEARSWFRPLATVPGLSLVEVDLSTGRTHQIRVHAQGLGHPLAGDTKYGGNAPPPGLDVPWLLHAWKLTSDLLPPLIAPLPPAQAAWLEKTFRISL